MTTNCFTAGRIPYELSSLSGDCLRVSARQLLGQVDHHARRGRGTPDHLHLLPGRVGRLHQQQQLRDKRHWRRRQN